MGIFLSSGSNSQCVIERDLLAIIGRMSRLPPEALSQPSIELSNRFVISHILKGKHLAKYAWMGDGCTSTPGVEAAWAGIQSVDYKIGDKPKAIGNV